MSNYVLSDTAVNKLKGVLSSARNNLGRARTAAPHPAETRHENAAPPLWTVQWAQSASGGQGAWIVWLGDSSDPLVTVGANEFSVLQIFQQMLNPGPPYSDGWWVLNILSPRDGGDLYVSLDRDTTQGIGRWEVTIRGTPLTPTTGHEVQNVLVAHVDVLTSGAHDVTQLVTGTIMFPPQNGIDTTQMSLHTYIIGEGGLEYNTSTHKLKLHVIPVTFINGRIVAKENATTFEIQAVEES